MTAWDRRRAVSGLPAVLITSRAVAQRGCHRGIEELLLQQLACSIVVSGQCDSATLIVQDGESDSQDSNLAIEIQGD